VHQIVRREWQQKGSAVRERVSVLMPWIAALPTVFRILKFQPVAWSSFYHGRSYSLLDRQLYANAPFFKIVITCLNVKKNKVERLCF